MEIDTRSAPLLAAVLVGALGCLLLAAYIRQLRHEISGGAPVTLLALRRDADAGERVEEDMLVRHSVPESYVESRQVTAQQLPRVLGIELAVDLQANQTLSWTDLRSTRRREASLAGRVPPGMRALRVARSSRHVFGQLLEPGDRIDVLLTRSKPGTAGFVVTIPLLQNVLVLAVGDRIESRSNEDLARRRDSVTLLVTVDQATLLAHAQRSGDLNFTLRNEHDLAISDGLPETDDDDVLVPERRARRQRRPSIERVD